MANRASLVFATAFRLLSRGSLFRRLWIIAAAAVLVNAFAASESVERDLLADFRFTGGLEEMANRGAVADITNAVLTTSGLELTRGYENAGEGYRATFTMPSLDLRNLTLVVDFQAWDFQGPSGSVGTLRRIGRRLRQAVRLRTAGADHGNIITGGRGYRWLGFNHATGHLQLALNNQTFTHDFTNVVVSTRSWHRLACSLDVGGRRVHVALDGRMLDSTPLPQDFILEVSAAPPPDGDRNITFANYGNGQAFHGSVARLQVFGRALKSDELLALGVPVFPGPIATSEEATWFAVVLVLALLLVGWARRKGRRARAS